MPRQRFLWLKQLGLLAWLLLFLAGCGTTSPSIQSEVPRGKMAKGIFLAYYEFAVGNLNSPYSYPPDISTSTSNSLLNEINSNNLVHPWNGAQVQANIALLENLRATYPSVPIYLTVNGGADGAYWHDAGSVYDADFHAAMVRLRAAGCKIFGYVDPTVYTVSLASAKEKVDRWYNFYGDILDGIFLDDYAVADYLPTWPYLSVAYYDDLNAYIRAKRNPTIPTTVPLICGNINGWYQGNRVNQDAAYFSAAQACDLWLVAESIVNPGNASPAGVPNSKKWALLYNTPSSSMTDAQFNDMMTYVDWVMVSERNYATYQFLPNWLTRQVQLLDALNGGTTSAPGPSALNADSLNGWGTLTNGSLAPATTTTVAPPPGVPQVALHAGNRQITLTWPAVQGATSYNVYHTSDGSDPTLGSARDSVSGGSAVFTGLVNGGYYKFAVSAVGASESALSSVVAGTPFMIDPLRFNVGDGTVLSFAETPGGPFRINVGGRVLEFAIGGSGPVRFNSDAGIIALSSPSDITIPQDLYSGGSLDLADMAGVLVARDLLSDGRLGDADAGIADTLPTDDLTGNSTLGTAEAAGVMVAANLAGTGTITDGIMGNALAADALVSTGALDEGTLGGGVAGVVADDLAGNSTIGTAELAGGVAADDLATTGSLDVPVTGGVVAGDDAGSTGTISAAELVALGMIGADALTGSGTLDPANLTMPDALPANDLAGGAGTLSTANLALVLTGDALTGSGTLDAADTWIPRSTIDFTNFTPDEPTSTVDFTNFS